MVNPVPVGATGVWLEANQSGCTAQRVAELIVHAFGYADDDFDLVVQQSA